MGNDKEQSYANIWDINVDKYGADSDGAEEIESTVREIESGGDGNAEKIVTDEAAVEEVESKESDADLPNSDAGEDSGEQGDEKQAEKEGESKEDASSEPETAEEELTAEEVEYSNIMQSLVDEGIVDFDEDKEYDVSTDKGLKELIQDTKAKTKEAALTEFKENLGEKEAKLLTVLEKGGTADDFIKMEQQIDFMDVPLQSKDGSDYEKNQMYLVEDWMKVQGYDKDEIEDTINDYLETGILKKQAGIAQKKLAKWQDTENKALLAQKEQEAAEQEKQAIEQAESFKEAVINTREIAGFTISDSKAKKLYDYITKKDKEGKSAFDKEDTAENRLLYAYFAMEGFDKDKLSKDVATKQARTLKKKLSRFSDKNTAPKRSAKEIRRTDQETPTIHWNV